MGEVIKGTVCADRYTMDYFYFGKGEKPLVIIPGISVQSVVPSAGAIEKAYREMEDEFTVYVIDRARQLPPDYKIQDMAEDTADAIERLGLKEICMFGASQGGMIAILTAASHPGLVRAMVLGSTCADITELRYKVMERWEVLAAGRDGAALYETFGNDIYPPAFMERFGKAMKRLGTLATEEEMDHFITLVRACRGMNLMDCLDHIVCPVLVIGAKDDAVFGPDAAPEIFERLKGREDCELYLYDGYGHACFDTAPDYKKRLLRFFAVHAS